MNGIYERLGALLTERCKVTGDQLAPMATLAELGLDSLDYITLAMAMQEEFDVDIDDQELAPTSTLADTVRLLESRLGLIRGD